jgi:type VI secretion system secreted protein Hcp
MANVDQYLKLDGIKGSSTDSKHKDELELMAHRWGVTQMTAIGSAQTGVSAGKSRAGHLICLKKCDVASPKLFVQCAAGQPIATATLVIRRAGKDQQEFCTYTFTNCLVASYYTSIGFQIEASDEKGISWCEESNIENPTSTGGFQYEYFALSYGALKFEFKSQNNDGTLGGAVSGQYSFQTNTSS